MREKINAVLFDLDGTLLDTVPDLLFALNRLRADLKLDPLPLSTIHPIANLGSKKMVQAAFELAEDHPEFQDLRERFIRYYEQHIADSTTFFPHVETVLEELDQREIAWGIVTNKLTRHGTALLKALKFDHRPHCVVYGDTLTFYKPDPRPLLHACEQMKVDARNVVFVGDAATDIIAAKAAGIQSLAALYGYISPDEDPYSWGADGYINDASEIVTWIRKR